jgi:hypothetical protein
MKDNPLMQYYASIYTLSMAAMLILKAIRGVVFVKVGHGGCLLCCLSLVTCGWLQHGLWVQQDGPS